jgi:predicted dehydrogenase
VSCRTHEITRLPAFLDRGFLRTDYDDIEDYSQLHVTFEDGTVADVYATELVMGGVHNWLDVFANNHRTSCRLNPVNLLDTYNPEGAQFKDVYVVEKIGTKEGWSHPAPDEEWQQGFYAEIQDFVECCVSGRRPQSSALVAHDTVAAMYAGYVSASRGGQDVAVPLSPIGEVE